MGRVSSSPWFFYLFTAVPLAYVVMKMALTPFTVLPIPQLHYSSDTPYFLTQHSSSSLSPPHPRHHPHPLCSKLPSVNTHLIDSCITMGNGTLVKPETIAFASDGFAYTGAEDGNIWRVDVDHLHRQAEVYVHVGGRPLGLVFDEHDNLYIAEPLKGLLRVDRNTKRIEILSNCVHGESDGVGMRVAYADDVDIAPNGKVYFSDAIGLGPEVDGFGNIDMFSSIRYSFSSGMMANAMVMVMVMVNMMTMSSLYDRNWNWATD